MTSSRSFDCNSSAARSRTEYSYNPAHLYYWRSGVANFAARPSHYYTAPLALPPSCSGSLGGCLADILKCRLEELPRRSRAFDISICPHGLCQLIRFLRINNAIGVVLRPEVSLQTKNDDGQSVDSVERPLGLVDPLPVHVSTCLS